MSPTLHLVLENYRLLFCGANKKRQLYCLKLYKATDTSSPNAKPVKSPLRCKSTSPKHHLHSVLFPASEGARHLHLCRVVQYSLTCGGCKPERRCSVRNVQRHLTLDCYCVSSCKQVERTETDPLMMSHILRYLYNTATATSV